MKYTLGLAKTLVVVNTSLYLVKALNFMPHKNKDIFYTAIILKFVGWKVKLAKTVKRWQGCKKKNLIVA